MYTIYLNILLRPDNNIHHTLTFILVSRVINNSINAKQNTFYPRTVKFLRFSDENSKLSV